MHSTLTNTLAALALLVAAAAAANDFSNVYKYETLVQKGHQSMEHLRDMGGFYLKDGQCSGLLIPDMFPEQCRPLHTLRVRVRNPLSVPGVDMAESLQRVAVTRAEPCGGRAEVEVSAGCGLLVAQPARSAVVAAAAAEPQPMQYLDYYA